MRGQVPGTSESNEDKSHVYAIQGTSVLDEDKSEVVRIPTICSELPGMQWVFRSTLHWCRVRSGYFAPVQFLSIVDAGNCLAVLR